jgi:hypothetical protein
VAPPEHQNDPVMQQFMLTQSDMQNAQTIQTQVSADAQLQQAERWKTLQDVQTKIFQIQQDVTVNKARTSDRQFSSWATYIRYAQDP